MISAASWAMLSVAAGLLVAAGGAKALRPEATTSALRAAGLPVRARLVRLGAIVELVIGAGTLVSASRVWALAVGLSYGALALFVAIALRRSLPLATCACFGEEDTPPSWWHVAVNVASCVAAFAVAVGLSSHRSLAATWSSRPGTAVVDTVSLAVVGYLTLVSITTLPRARAHTAGS